MVNPVPTVPGKPTITSPTNGSTTSDTTPTLRWSTVSGADYYLLWFSAVNGNVIYNNVRVNTAGGTTGELTSGEYGFGVKACNDSYGCSDYSSQVRFTVQ